VTAFGGVGDLEFMINDNLTNEKECLRRVYMRLLVYN